MNIDLSVSKGKMFRILVWFALLFVSFGLAPAQNSSSALNQFSPEKIENFSNKISSVPLLAELSNSDATSDTSQGTSKESNLLDVLESKNMDIGDVLKIIAQKSGLNIVTGSNVQGKVTIYLKDIDVRDALRIILESNDLAYIEDNGVIRVMTAKDFESKYGHSFAENLQTSIIKLQHSQAADLNNVLNQMKTTKGKVIIDEQSNTLILMDAPDKLSAMQKFVKEIDVPWKTEVFDLNAAHADDIVTRVNESLTTNVGKVKFDKSANRMVVTDTAQKIEEIRKIIHDFDQKEPEVLIQTKVVQIVLNDEHKMGVDWEAIVSDYHSLNLKNKSGLANDNEKKEKLCVGTISQDDYLILLEALDTVGKTSVLSNSQIITVNNKETKIAVGAFEPNGSTNPASGSSNSESVNLVKVGEQLHVTPMVHQDGAIAMKIKPEVNSILSSSVTENNNLSMMVSTSEAEVIVNIKDSVTIVIGGLIKDEKIESIKKIPLLGDLPFLGFAFRNEGQMIRKTESVIFLTPRVISNDTGTNPGSPEEK